MKKDNFSNKTKVSSFYYAIRGTYSFFKSEANAKIHLFGALIAIILGIYLKIDLLEWVLISFAISLVLLTEMINTSIEKLTDMVSPEWNQKAGLIKDIAAAAVLISAILSLIVASIIFIPKFF